MALERRVLEVDLFRGLHVTDGGFALEGKYNVAYCTRLLERAVYCGERDGEIIR